MLELTTLMIVFCVAVLVAVVGFLWNLATGSSGECDTVFQDNTSFLMDIGVRALSNDLEGGFVKIWYEGKDCELQINFPETPMLRFIDKWESPEQYMESMYKIQRDEYEKFQSMVKMDIQKSDEFTDQICFYHKYNCSGNGVVRRKWLVDHIKDRYSQHRVSEYSDSIALFVNGK